MRSASPEAEWRAVSDGRKVSRVAVTMAQFSTVTDTCKIH